MCLLNYEILYIEFFVLMVIYCEGRNIDLL